MKNIDKVSSLLVFILLVAFQTQAQLKIGLPAPSPEANLKQKIGLTTVNLKYSRPGMKGRKIFGETVPYGSVWRTGANLATILEFDTKVTIEGKEVPKGKYSLYTIPGNNEWTIILNKQISWGTRYNEAKDFVRFKVKSRKIQYTVETFTMDFSNFTTNAANLNISWENTVTSFTIKTEVDSKVMARINGYMKNPERSLINLYFESASYYYTTNRDMNKALTWINKALALYPDAYWMVHLKAKIQGRLKDYKGAITTAKLSIEKAKKGKNPDYVRLNKKVIGQWEKEMKNK